jgi:hypothetical protein
MYELTLIFLSKNRISDLSHFHIRCFFGQINTGISLEVTIEQIGSGKFDQKKIVRSQVGFGSIRSGSGLISDRTLSVFSGFESFRVGPGQFLDSYVLRLFQASGHSSPSRIGFESFDTGSLGSDRARSVFLSCFI